ncbi:MAG: hypothetical protein R3199_02020 [Gemmatimonadota bacterium]|nr:hypothetical protein [Gemmatimonadota bacterium]
MTEGAKRDARADEPGGMQGELEGLGGDPAPGVPPPSTEPAEREESPDEAEPVTEGEPDEVDSAERLRDALVVLEAKVGRLIESRAEIAERHRAAREEARRLAERLERLESPELDPVELESKVRGLERQNERLRAHAEALEERIESMLNRIRYVVEA